MSLGLMLYRFSARRNIAILILIVAAPALLLAQTQVQSGIAMAPQQMRRAEPPPANATSDQLENLADELRLEKSYTDAIDYYQAAMQKAPNSAVLHNKIGICALQLARWDQARKEFEKAAKLDKTYPEAFNNAGVVYYLQKKHKKAIKYYEKALELRPESASFHSNLGSAYFSRKEYEKANAEYLRAMEIDPDVFEHRSTAGISFQSSSPEDRALYNYILAKMYARMGNADRSLLYLRKAMEDGYAKIQSVYSDSEFAGLRKDPRFNELMAAKPVSLPN
jgi:tetratricopeptide (TPR) repeat protein